MSKKFNDKNGFACDGFHIWESQDSRMASLRLLKGAFHYNRHLTTGEEAADPKIAVFAKCYSCMYKSGIRHKDCPDIACPLNPITFGCLYKLRSVA
jgi:hypothetical protein